MRLHICRITLEPSSVYKNHKIYAYWLYDFFISLHLFYFWWPNAHKPSETLQFMALPCDWRFNSLFDHKSDTVVEFDIDRCVFLLWLPNFRKFCMSKHSCSYVIIVPWNNIQKRLYTTVYFFYAEKALASLYICTGSPESSSWYWNIMYWLKWRFLQRLCEQRMMWWVCISNHRNSMQPSVRCINASKMLPVRCNKNFSIKHLLVYQEKTNKVVIVFWMLFHGNMTTAALRHADFTQFRQLH